MNRTLIHAGFARRGQRIFFAALLFGLGTVACSADDGEPGETSVRRRDASTGDGTVIDDDAALPGDDTGTIGPMDDASPPPTDGGLVENCDTPFDDNGDGQANENCPCLPTDPPRECFQRQQPEFRGMCRMGQQRCVGAGEIGTWGPCERSWLPLPAFMNQCEATQTFTDMMATRAPVDIIWFIDTSGSMVEETMNLNANLNRFASSLASSGLDYRVIVIGTRGTGTLQVCVPPPLAGAGCADGPRFRHINSYVSSNNGLQVVINTYPMWRDFLRPTSVKFFVAVTDDESRPMTSDMFHATASAWPGFAGYVFNSIVGYESRTDCPTLAARGTQYLNLTARTMGDRARVCATDWSTIFTSFASGIARRTTAWTLTAPARPDTIQVWIISAGGVRTRLTTGWTYDPMANRVTVDPASVPAGARVEIIYRPASASP